MRANWETAHFCAWVVVSNLRTTWTALRINITSRTHSSISILFFLWSVECSEKLRRSLCILCTRNRKLVFCRERFAGFLSDARSLATQHNKTAHRCKKNPRSVKSIHTCTTTLLASWVSKLLAGKLLCPMSLCFTGRLVGRGAKTLFLRPILMRLVLN
jgi:hypothetical protein